jgi:hypothetical protein
MSISASERRTLLYAGVAIALAVGYRFGVKPFHTALGEARSELKAAQTALAEARATVAGGPSSPELVQTVNSAMASMESRLFDGADEKAAGAELSSYVAALARSNHVLINSAGTRAFDVDSTGIRILRAELHAESDLRGFLEWLDAIDHGDRLVRVERIEMSKPASTEENKAFETLTMTLVVNGYANGDPPPPKKGRGSSAPGASKVPAMPASARGGSQ